MNVSITAQIKAEARRLGFQLSGICPAEPPPGLDNLVEWLRRGYHGQMRYLPDRLDAYRHPDGVLDGARSIVMLSMDYQTEPAVAGSQTKGRIACYGWGADYHDLIHERLKQLIGVVQTLLPDCRARGVVDTAPLLERDYARQAGLGWIGKNTLLLNRERGSWFFLAALLIDSELDYDEPFVADHCGTCTACLDACPTDAFPQPYVLDATKCISYLTIELREAMDAELRDHIGDWLFGCDVCQEVCPWNHRAPTTAVAEFQPFQGHNPVDLAPLFDLHDDGFRQRFRGTPLWRSKRRGLLRNAAIVLGNQGSTDAVPALIKGLSDEEPLVRGASAWALGRIGGADAQRCLLAALTESEAAVAWEIQRALHEIHVRQPSTAWTTGCQLARALDQEDYPQAADLIADRCIYELAGQKLIGPEPIIESYADNGDAAKDRFETISYESAVAVVQDHALLVHFRDHLSIGDRSHTFQCRQWLTLNDDDSLVIAIRHEEFPGQRTALAEFEAAEPTS